MWPACIVICLMLTGDVDSQPAHLYADVSYSSKPSKISIIKVKLILFWSKISYFCLSIKFASDGPNGFCLGSESCTYRFGKYEVITSCVGRVPLQLQFAVVWLKQLIFNHFHSIHHSTTVNVNISAACH